MVYDITFRPHLHPADDTSLYALVYKCIYTLVSSTQRRQNQNIMQHNNHTI